MVQPDSARELAAMLASGSREIEIGGSFSKRAWGGPLPSDPLRLSTRKLDRVLQYEPRDLTISVEAGMRYSALLPLLHRNSQMLPIDPPYAAEATLGGILAANSSGPRRRLYGSVRDFVIGMEFATMEGKLVSCGGMVVKNVAGLDMGKLMIGSYGTLAVITRVNFKLMPLPSQSLTFLYSYSAAADAIQERDRILRSVLQPSAIDLLNPAAAARIGRGGFMLAIRVDGSAALVERYRRELAGAEAIDDPKFWHAIQEFSAAFLRDNPSGSLVRFSGSLREAAALLLTESKPLLIRAGNGIAYTHYASSPENPVSGVIEAGAKSETAWPAPGSAFPVMQKIKHMLDPAGLLNKGRLYGRI